MIKCPKKKRNVVNVEKISPLLSVDKDGTTIKLKSEKKTFKPIKRILDDK